MRTGSSRRSWPDSVPLFATPRSPERETLGPNLAQVGDVLGKSFMPHQRLISDVALEINPDDEDEFAYRGVIIVLPRQQGKSELILPLVTWRAMAWPSQRILYASLTATEARRRFTDVQLPRLEESPFAGLFRPRRRLTFEAVLWRNGSIYSPISTTATTGGTGDTSCRASLRG